MHAAMNDRPEPLGPAGDMPAGMRWCPRCSGYGSSLKEDAERCSHCGGSGLVWAEDDARVTTRNGEHAPGEHD
jgi:hypothetical protein